MFRDSIFRSGGFKCTCQDYLKEYDCLHALAMSTAKNKLSTYMSMEIPIGQKKGLDAHQKPTRRDELRRWSEFFSRECGIVHDKERVNVSVFLGCHSLEHESLLLGATKKDFTLIGPDESHYEVKV